MAYRFYNTLVEMKNNAASIASGDICETLGYYIALDGGRGRYYIKTDSTSVDDGGYIIRLNTSRTATLILEKNEINALQYGAHGNWKQYPNEPARANWPSYDNKAIFDKMMKRARDLKCSVYIPAGIYMCAPTSSTSSLITMYSNVTLRGDGASTILTLPTIEGIISQPYDFGVLVAEDVSNFTVKDLVLNGNRYRKSDGTYTSEGIWGSTFFHALRGTFENVICQNCASSGFRIAGSEKVTYNHCRCTDTKYGFTSLGSGETFQITDLLITNSIIEGTFGAGGIILATNVSNNIVVTNNIFRSNETGVAVTFGQSTAPTSNPKFWAENVILADNIIYDWSAGIIAYYTSHLSVTGNNIGTCASGSGLTLRNCEDSIIADNQIYQCANDNINISSSSHVLVSNNILKDNSYKRTTSNNGFGYLNLADNNRISIHGNHIYQELTSAQKYIRINTGNKHIVMDGNDTYNDYRDSTITTDVPVRLWLDGTNETNCVKDSYFEIPPYMDLYNAYPASISDNKNHSNFIQRRVETIKNYYSNENPDELARCCFVDATAQYFKNLTLKPVNTRLLLIFNPNRGYDTELQAGGNIHFKENNRIARNVECVIELVCLGNYWAEVSRSQNQ